MGFLDSQEWGGQYGIQRELMTNGPSEASFTVYEDFLNYKTGVYQHIAGKLLGAHAVRLPGWGKEGERNSVLAGGELLGRGLGRRGELQDTEGL